MEVQTRNFDGELEFWPTIAEAFAAALSDKSIWKISWTNEETEERVRLVRQVGLTPSGPGRLIKSQDVWIYEPILFPRIDPTLPENFTVEDFLKNE